MERESISLKSPICRLSGNNLGWGSGNCCLVMPLGVVGHDDGLAPSFLSDCLGWGNDGHGMRFQQMSADHVDWTVE